MIKNRTIAQIATLGIDIGKSSCHVIGFNAEGAIVLMNKFTAAKLGSRLANLPACLIGIGACVGAHHLARRLIGLGHDA